MRKALIILTALIALTSCQLETVDKDYRVHFVSVACNYVGLEHINELEGTLNDQRLFNEQLAYLGRQSGVTFTSELLSQGSVDADTGRDDLLEEGAFRTSLSTDGSVTRRSVDTGHFTEELEAIIKEAASSLGEGDVLIFHYSGHGMDDGGQLALPDTDSTEELKIQALELETLRAMLESVQCDRLVILDSCFSGNIIRDGDIDPRTDFITALSALFKPTGAQVIHTWISAAAHSTEEAFTVDGYAIPIGMHSQAILEALGYDFDAMRPALPDDRLITMNGILSAASSEHSPFSRQHSLESETTRDLVLFQI